MTAKAAPVKKDVLTTKSALAERFKNYPALNVLERRLDDPRDPGAPAILLKDEPAPLCLNTEHWVKHTVRIAEGLLKCPTCRLPFRTWYVRWINAGEENRWSTIKARGYVPVEIAELPDADEVATLYRSEKDAFVRRGDRGQEVLCKIPFPYFLEFQRKKEVLRKRKMTPTAIKQQLAEEAGRDLGSEAGDFLHDNVKLTEYRRLRARPLQEELEGGTATDAD